MTERWDRVAEGAEVQEGVPVAASAGGVELVVLRTRFGLKAYEGRCPHRGALLGEGEVEGDELVCRNHQWRFDIATGKRDRGGACLRPCPIRENRGVVEVDVTPLLAAAEKRTTTRSLETLPGPPRLPLIGSAHLLSPSSLHLQLEGWAREFGTPYFYRFATKRILVLAEMDDLTPPFRERPLLYRRTSNLEKIFEELEVAGVFSAEGSRWRPQRRLAMEALSARHLRSFYPTLRNVAERLIRRFERLADERRDVDIAEELKRFTVDVTTLLAFGYDIDTLDKDEDVIQRKLELMFPTLNRRLFSVLPYWRFLPIPEELRANRANREIQAWLRELLATTKSKMASRGEAVGPSNFLEAMIAARDDDGNPFDDRTILGNAMTMLLAGEDTTAYTLAWAMHHLLDAPAEVAALRDELREVLGGSTIPSDMETANRLVRAGAVANESMRLRPVAPVLFFDAIEDTTIGDLAVPKDTTLALLIRPPAVDAANFADPESFRPARWLSAEGAHEAAAHLPFGSGPRVCPGRSLALLEMKLVLAALYGTFDFERVGRTEDVKELFAFTMMPTGLRLRVRRRPPIARQVATDEASGVSAPSA